MVKNTENNNYHTVAVPKLSRLQRCIDKENEETNVAKGQLIAYYASKYLEILELTTPHYEEKGIVLSERIPISFSINHKSPVLPALIKAAIEYDITLSELVKRIFTISIKEGKGIKLERTLPKTKVADASKPEETPTILPST